MDKTISGLKDPTGLVYKHPARSCDKCLQYPCIDNMSILVSNFAAYGCENYTEFIQSRRGHL